MRCCITTQEPDHGPSQAALSGPPASSGHRAIGEPVAARRRGHGGPGRPRHVDRPPQRGPGRRRGHADLACRDRRRARLPDERRAADHGPRPGRPGRAGAGPGGYLQDRRRTRGRRRPAGRRQLGRLGRPGVGRHRLRRRARRRPPGSRRGHPASTRRAPEPTRDAHRRRPADPLRGDRADDRLGPRQLHPHHPAWSRRADDRQPRVRATTGSRGRATAWASRR